MMLDPLMPLLLFPPVAALFAGALAFAIAAGILAFGGWSRGALTGAILTGVMVGLATYAWVDYLPVSHARLSKRDTLLPLGMACVMAALLAAGRHERLRPQNPPSRLWWRRWVGRSVGTFAGGFGAYLVILEWFGVRAGWY